MVKTFPALLPTPAVGKHLLLTKLLDWVKRLMLIVVRMHSMHEWFFPSQFLLFTFQCCEKKITEIEKQIHNEHMAEYRKRICQLHLQMGKRFFLAMSERLTASSTARQPIQWRQGVNRFLLRQFREFPPIPIIACTFFPARISILCVESRTEFSDSHQCALFTNCGLKRLWNRLTISNYANVRTSLEFRCGILGSI